MPRMEAERDSKGKMRNTNFSKWNNAIDPCVRKSSNCATVKSGKHTAGDAPTFRVNLVMPKNKSAQYRESEERKTVVSRIHLRLQ
mmetsp:Transcript_44885/g.111776  ORF Transcript_44885/g.111776 Transcript_44885/m.111776 type:complete len:85 (-) Transcript_44885:359-613(-)